MQNSVDITNCPRRQAFWVHLVIKGLQIKRSKSRELAFAKCWASEAGEQRLVVREGLISQFRDGLEQ